MPPVVLHLILTLVVIMCMWFVGQWADSAPFGDATAKWCLKGIIILIGVCAILAIWGLWGSAGVC